VPWAELDPLDPLVLLDLPALLAPLERTAPVELAVTLALLDPPERTA